MPRKAKSFDKATIVDVAKVANVSYATVSRVANNKDNVASATRERVLKAMGELSYQANLNARRLVSGQSNVLGLLVHGLMGQYISEIMSGIDDALWASDYELVLYTTHRRRDREARYIAMMAGGMADGLIIVLPREPEAYVRALRLRQFPYVLIDHKGIDGEDLSVVAANWQGAFDATQYLLHLGHRRIGFITGAIDMDNAQDRLAGYKAALAANQAGFDPALVFEGDYMQPSGVTGAHRLLSLGEPPTAIFASSDLCAFGVYDAARQRGLTIPQDLSVLGFDDIPMASLVHPRLTTVRQPLIDMGRIATRMLMQLLQKPDKPASSVVVPTELVVRHSTGPCLN